LKTDVWQKSWAQGFSKPYSSTNICEFYQNIVVLIVGQLICLPIPYHISTNENHAIDTAHDNRSLLFSTWSNDPKYSVERIDFIESLGDMLYKKGDLGLEDSQKVIVEGIETINKIHYEHSIATTLFGPKISKKSIDMLKKMFFNKSLMKIYVICRSIALSFITKSHFVTLDKLPNKTTGTGILINIDQQIEIKAIERIILGFYGKV